MPQTRPGRYGTGSVDSGAGWLLHECRYSGQAGFKRSSLPALKTAFSASKPLPASPPNRCASC